MKTGAKIGIAVGLAVVLALLVTFKAGAAPAPSPEIPREPLDMRWE